MLIGEGIANATKQLAIQFPPIIRDFKRLGNKLS